MATLVHTTQGRHIRPSALSVFGRSTRAQIPLDHPKVSAMHARLAWAEGAWTLRDLGSRNGTEVNGERLAPGADHVLRAGDRISFGAADETWTVRDLHPPDAPRDTRITVGALDEEVRMDFEVSRDEEHTLLTIRYAGQQHVIPNRSHHYLLVVLARQRLADRADGVPDSDAGWVDQADLERRLRLTGKALNVQVHRARKELEAIGIPGASKVIERRRGTGQVRVGFGTLTVVHVGDTVPIGVALKSDEVRVDK